MISKEIEERIIELNKENDNKEEILNTDLENEDREMFENNIVITLSEIEELEQLLPLAIEQDKVFMEMYKQLKSCMKDFDNISKECSRITEVFEHNLQEYKIAIKKADKIINKQA